MDKKTVPKALIDLQIGLGLTPVEELSDLVKVFKSWARVPGQERWQLKELDTLIDKRASIYNNLEQLGFISKLKPSIKHARYVGVLGSTCFSMLERLQYLCSLVYEGLTFDSLVFFTGQRPLDPLVDSFQEMMNFIRHTPGASDFSGNVHPISETEAAILIYEYLDMPKEIKSKPVLFVDTPRTWRGTVWYRPNTADTVVSWIKHNIIDEGDTIMVSSQPFVPYQHNAVRAVLPKGFYLETVASEVMEFQPLAIILDAVYSWLKDLDSFENLNPALIN